MNSCYSAMIVDFSLSKFINGKSCKKIYSKILDIENLKKISQHNGSLATIT